MTPTRFLHPPLDETQVFPGPTWPRFGFAWDVFGNRRTSIRGRYGLFNDSIKPTRSGSTS